jgi:F0F1-type ATP synthase assembly protein I
MVAVPAVLGFVGAMIDRSIGTGPILLIVFAALGVVCAFASAYFRYEARIAHQDAGKPWARSRRTGEGAA